MGKVNPVKEKYDAKRLFNKYVRDEKAAKEDFLNTLGEMTEQGKQNRAEDAAAEKLKAQTQGGGAPQQTSFAEPEDQPIGDAGNPIVKPMVGGLQGNVKETEQTAPGPASEGGLPPRTQDTTTTRTGGGSGLLGAIQMLSGKGSESTRSGPNPAFETALQERSASIGNAAFRMANGNMRPDRFAPYAESQMVGMTPAEKKRVMTESQQTSTALLARQDETDQIAGKNMMVAAMNVDPSLAGKGGIDASFALSRCRGTEECTIASEKWAKVVQSGDVAKSNKAYADALSVKTQMEAEQALRSNQRDSVEHAIFMSGVAQDGASLWLGLNGKRDQAQVDDALESYIQKDGSIKTTLQTKPKFEGIQQDQYRLGLDVTTAVEGGFFSGEDHFDKIEPRRVEEAQDILRGSIPGNRDSAVEYLASIGFSFRQEEGFVTHGEKGSPLFKLGAIHPGPGFTESDYVYGPTPGGPDETILGFMDRSNIYKTAMEAPTEKNPEGTVIKHFLDITGSRTREEYFDEQVGGPATEPGLRATLGLAGTGSPQLGPNQTRFGEQRQPAGAQTAAGRGKATGAHIRGALSAVAPAMRRVNKLPLKGLQALDKVGDPINAFLVDAFKEITRDEPPKER